MIEKPIQKVVSVTLFFLIVIGVSVWIENRPPIPPSEVRIIAAGIALFFLPPAFMAWKKISRQRVNFHFVDIMLYVRFIVPIHIAVYLFCVALFGWFDPDDLGAMRMAIFDTAFKGALFDFPESFNLELSSYKPETNLFIWRLIDSIFRLAYGVVTTATFARLHQLWRMRRSPR